MGIFEEIFVYFSCDSLRLLRIKRVAIPVLKSTGILGSGIPSKENLRLSTCQNAVVFIASVEISKLYTCPFNTFRVTLSVPEKLLARLNNSVHDITGEPVFRVPTPSRNATSFISHPLRPKRNL